MRRMRDEKLGALANCVGTVLELDDPRELEKLEAINSYLRETAGRKRTIPWQKALHDQWVELNRLANERWLEPFWWPLASSRFRCTIVPVDLCIAEFRERRTDKRVYTVSQEGVVLYSPEDPVLMDALELRHFLAWHEELDLHGIILFAGVKEVATGERAREVIRRHAS